MSSVGSGLSFADLVFCHGFDYIPLRSLRQLASHDHDVRRLLNVVADSVRAYCDQPFRDGLEDGEGAFTAVACSAGLPGHF